MGMIVTGTVSQWQIPRARVRRAGLHSSKGGEGVSYWGFPRDMAEDLAVSSIRLKNRPDHLLRFQMPVRPSADQQQTPG